MPGLSKRPRIKHQGKLINISTHDKDVCCIITTIHLVIAIHSSQLSEVQNPSTSISTWFPVSCLLSGPMLCASHNELALPSGEIKKDCAVPLNASKSSAVHIASQIVATPQGHQGSPLILQQQTTHEFTVSNTSFLPLTLQLSFEYTPSSRLHAFWINPKLGPN
jgi:hypothetical protein